MRIIVFPLVVSQSSHGWHRPFLAFVVLLLATLLPSLAAAGEGDGCGWSAGFHHRGLDGRVRVLEMWDDGNGTSLYVGGSFEWAEELESPALARWDGIHWQAILGSEGSASHDVSSASRAAPNCPSPAS